MKISIISLTLFATLVSSAIADDFLKCTLLKNSKKVVSIEKINIAEDSAAGDIQKFDAGKNPTGEALHYAILNESISFGVNDDIAKTNRSEMKYFSSFDKKIFTDLPKKSLTLIVLGNEGTYTISCINRNDDLN